MGSRHDEPSASIAYRLPDRVGSIRVSINAETVRGEPRGEDWTSIASGAAASGRG